jgi:hypothetical protein
MHCHPGHEDARDAAKFLTTAYRRRIRVEWYGDATGFTGVHARHRISDTDALACGSTGDTVEGGHRREVLSDGAGEWHEEG